CSSVRNLAASFVTSIHMSLRCDPPLLMSLPGSLTHSAIHFCRPAHGAQDSALSTRLVAHSVFSQQLPYLSGSHWYVDVTHPEMPQSVHHLVHNRCRSPHRSGLAHSLRSEWMMRRRRTRFIGLPRRSLNCGWHQIVHEAAIQIV